MTTVDGRTVRRQTNRARVVEAMLELIDATGREPTVDDLVARSGVSERSIFRYFDNLDDLRRAVLARNFDRVEPLLDVEDLGVGPLEDRVARFVDTRLRVCEALAGASRVARRNARDQPLVAAEIRRMRARLGHQIRAHFAPELDLRTTAYGDDLVLVIDVLVSADSWDRLTVEHTRSKAQVRRAWTAALNALLPR